MRAKSRTAPDLDLRPPVRLELWASAVALSILAGTVVPAVGPGLIAASAAVSAGALVWPDLVPREWRPMAILLPLFVAGGTAIALLHASTADPLEELAALEPGEVVIVGSVSSAPATTAYGARADLRVEHLWYAGKEVLGGGGVEVFAAGLDGVGVGDRLRVEGEIFLPDSGETAFDYARHLSTRHLSAVVHAASVTPVDGERGWIGRVHQRTDVALSYGLRPSEAAIVRGMVLGDRSFIPAEMERAFRRSGITHILAISGQHVAVLAVLLYFMFRALALSVAGRLLATLSLMWLYIVVAGAPPSAIRAGVVATLVFSARLAGRQISPLCFMTTMLAVVLAYNPLLAYNTGFQLSVAAASGILLLRKPLRCLAESTVLRPFGKAVAPASNLLAVSLAAQIATAPIVAAVFQEVSIVGVLTNLFAVPLSGPVLALGLLASVVGNVTPFLAYPINYANGFLVTVLEWLAQGAAALPFAAVRTPGATLPLVALFYLGCVPTTVAEKIVPERRWPFWAAVLVLWVVLWLVLVGAPSV